jgi:hypothetical protein
MVYNTAIESIILAYRPKVKPYFAKKPNVYGKLIDFLWLFLKKRLAFYKLLW